MRFAVIFRILGILLMLFSLSYIAPMLVSLHYQDGSASSFIYAFLITITAGSLFWIPFARHKQELRARDGFLITVMFWFVLSLFGALPLLLSPALDMSVTDAVFESVSGLTTTGATVITGLETLPRSILFYRQLLQWFGGIGIVVIAVAILPMLGVGGMQLYRAETPGPVKDSKLTPRIAETAKILFFIYVVLTACCAAAYWVAGMSTFDAISHAFSTISIGGFSTYDASLGHFVNQDGWRGTAIAFIAVFFMLLAGVNFALHFYAFSRRQVSHYLADSEAKAYFVIITISAVIVFISLLLQKFQFGDALVHGLFQTVSIMTTTGFATANFSGWSEFTAVFLVSLAFFGACAGSTGGGIKIGRMIILMKQTLREITRLVHPNAVLPIKVGNRPVQQKVADAIWGFFGAYLIIFNLMLLILLATGLDFLTAWSAVAATINNLGPGLGEVSANFANISNTAKWILCVCMILGRLELFTLIVLFLPLFWRT